LIHAVYVSREKGSMNSPGKIFPTWDDSRGEVLYNQFFSLFHFIGSIPDEVYLPTFGPEVDLKVHWVVFLPPAARDANF